MKHKFVITLFVLLFTLLLCTGVQSDAQEKNNAVVPAQAQIQGVPFLSFAEASRLKYPEKEIVNPALPATSGMILQYWGQKLSLVSRKDGVESLEKKGWISQSKEAQSLDELKAFIARGIPVTVSAAVTPYGHYLNPAWVAFLAAMSSDKTSEDYNFLEKLDKEDSSTGILGRMISLGTFPKVKTLLKVEFNPIRESALDTPCILIGYDDARNVVTLHSPSFGPAWEISYDDFKKMWEAYDRRYYVLYPPDNADFLAKLPKPAPYRERTPGEKAAVYFLNGYALSSLGQVAEAEATFQKGMTLPDIGPGYQQLFLMEIASIYHTQKRFTEAIETLQKAISFLPENGVAWVLLSHMYQEPGIPDGATKGRETEAKVEKLRRDRKAAETTAKILPRDFHIPFLGPIRGWAYR
jgi:tetratricopeptide (TPR) repeat protein